MEVFSFDSSDVDFSEPGWWLEFVFEWVEIFDFDFESSRLAWSIENVGVVITIGLLVNNSLTFRIDISFVVEIVDFTGQQSDWICLRVRNDKNNE